jgi:D-amino peptidase
MKVLIITDNEGVCGVCLEEEAESPAARKQLTAEVNAAIAGALDFAPGSEFVVVDAHYGGWRGHNVQIEDLHPAARLINGKKNMELPVLEPFDALFAIGVHAMAGTPQGTLNHTIGFSTMLNLYINGVVHGESGIWAALAGDHGIPLCLVAGDHWACEEIRALLPHVRTVAVKKGINRFSAEHLATQEACRRIREAAALAAAEAKNAPPYRVSHPVEVRIDYASTDLADAAEANGGKRVGNRTVAFTGERVAEAMR